jgi:cytochrome P450
MTASTGGEPGSRKAQEHSLRTLDSLPRVGIRDFARDRGRFARPGRPRSPLWGMGDRVLIDFPVGPTVVLTSDPEDAKAVFSNRDGALSFGEMLRRFTPHEPLFGSDAYIFREGDEHLKERRKVAPPLHGKALKSYERAMVDIVLRRLPEWPLGKPISFSQLGGQLALDVMMTVIFGVSDPDRMRRLERAMSAYNAVAESPSFLGVGVLTTLLSGRWTAIPRLARTAAAVDAIVLEEIAERRRTGSRTDDCLTMYLDIDAADDQPRGDEFLARSMRGLMLAGYAATTVTLGWLADLVVDHPESLAALEASLDRGEEDYLDAVIAETLRLRPALPFTGRRALQEFDLNGLLIPRDAYILIGIMALHERAELYPDPLAFRPDRFVGARPKAHSWVPFGGGAHYCLGAEFALFEARVLLRTLFEHRRLGGVAGHIGGRSSRTHPLPVPAGGAPVVLTARH